MSPRRRLLLALVAAAVVVALAVVAVTVLTTRGPAAPPGSRPAQDALGPVLLVPGYGGSRASLAPLASRLRAEGRDARVLTLVGDGRGDLSAQVVALDTAVDAALAAGAPSVDVVGYSAGGVVAGLWVARDDGAVKARRVVTLGAPLAGTTLAAVATAEAPDACPPACRQLAPGSTVLAELARASVGSALPWLSLWTADDRTVTPPESARLPGAVNVRLQDLCPGAVVSHDALPADPAVAAIVVAALGTGPLGTGSASTGSGCPA